jgi:hypothetical protein
MLSIGWFDCHSFNPIPIRVAVIEGHRYARRHVSVTHLVRGPCILCVNAQNVNGTGTCLHKGTQYKADRSFRSTYGEASGGNGRQSSPAGNGPLRLCTGFSGRSLLISALCVPQGLTPCTHFNENLCSETTGETAGEITEKPLNILADPALATLSIDSFIIGSICDSLRVWTAERLGRRDSGWAFLSWRSNRDQTCRSIYVDSC